MKIERIGNYFHVDERGYLINNCNIHNNQPHWLAVVEAVKEVYLTNWNDIHSIYLRGSIAKAIAIDRVSDIDSFAVLKPGIESTDILDRSQIEAWAMESETGLQTRFPFITGLEVVLLLFESIEDRNNIYNFTIKVQATCIYGKDIASQIEPYKIDREIAFQTKYIHFHIEQFWSEFYNETEQEKKLWLNWLMRRFLRLGMEFVMEAERLYTRDLYLCYESFAKHYSQQAKQMYFALELAINPKIDRDTISFVRKFGDWLVARASTKLRYWGYTQNEERCWVDSN